MDYDLSEIIKTTDKIRVSIDFDRINEVANTLNNLTKSPAFDNIDKACKNLENLRNNSTFDKFNEVSKKIYSFLQNETFNKGFDSLNKYVSNLNSSNELTKIYENFILNTSESKTLKNEFKNVTENDIISCIDNSELEEKQKLPLINLVQNKKLPKLETFGNFLKNSYNTADKMNSTVANAINPLFYLWLIIAFLIHARKKK